MADYKILKVSSEMPRTWGENAMKTYYIKTMLEGHPRPVEVGKKKPDALSPGMVIHGEIQPKPQFEADGFKPDASAFQAPGQTSFGASKPAYKDNSDGMRQGMCMNNAAAYVTASTKKELTGDEWATKVYDYANALYNKGDLRHDEPEHKAPEGGFGDDDFNALAKGLSAEGMSPEDIANIPF